jgi:hypothetical protein
LRELLVSELVKELLGPRLGIREVILGSPLSEYVTGVLAPLTDMTVSDPEAEAEIPFTDSQAYDEDAHDTDVDSPPLLSPALHPKRRPMSIGLSFAVDSKVDAISICLTWSKYERGKQVGTWVRTPRVYTGNSSIDSDRIAWIGPDGKPTTPELAEISLHLLVKKNPGNASMISLFLVNRIKFLPSKPDENPRTEHHIFQPQIRVAADPNTVIVPWTEGRIGTDEDEELAMLYRNRPLLARGHLCSAIWKEIDPERPYEGSLDFPDCKSNPPFNWIDGDLLPEPERSRFSPAGVRTEFVPAYSIPSPRLDWSNTGGTTPQLNAAFLAETWDPHELRKALEPISSKYEEWIEDSKRKIDQLSQSEKNVAQRLIQQCKLVHDRIVDGVKLLTRDEDVRLAFCFANKALDTQWRWAHRTGLEWRPFQMAFVLMTIESIVSTKSSNRDVCDLLWVPTGGGKTEAYLAVAALAFAYRRRRLLTEGTFASSGVSVITRYTLRLLTIQQFRRTLSIVTAAEQLRVFGFGSGKMGWRPAACSISSDFLWGSVPFKIGLWVGGEVTPNKLEDSWGGNQTLRGALSILQGFSGQGEPAQILRCPACQSILAVPSTGLSSGTYNLHFTVLLRGGSLPPDISSLLTGRYGDISVKTVRKSDHQSPKYSTLTLEVTANKTIRPLDLDSFWKNIEGKLSSVRLVSIRASRPGYFARWFLGAKGDEEMYDFEIFCPNPVCDLRTPWIGGAPSGSTLGAFSILSKKPDLPDGNRSVGVNPAFRGPQANSSDRVPIPALTVDDQIYRQVPTMIVATVDKFARPPFEPRAAAFFGNVDFHHPVWGYYRPHQYPPGEDSDGHPKRLPLEPASNRITVPRLGPPDLILQDELHLIEGPLGSLVGFYEGGVDYLCQEHEGIKVKYLASTATVRRASQQVQSVFSRKLQIFPPHSLTSDDRFFVREINDSMVHVLDDRGPGRLYLGIAAPGRGPLTPLVRIWARLLQTSWTNRSHPDIDSFWTLTGYFNAIRELAGVRALYRQDIRERLRDVAGATARPIPADRCQELSSVTDSVELPAVLDLLSKEYPFAEDSVLTTSMFGTGVDVPRIGLMVVHGQPKTTSSYIQSTGRVGRKKGGLVVTFLRATRPRDLIHYEFFAGYHRQLHRFVEPITVFPFSPGVIERAGGPVAVFILRNKSQFTVSWYDPTSAFLMGTNRTSAPEITEIVTALDNRGTVQPGSQTMQKGSVKKRLDPMLDLWQNVAQRKGVSLRYVEYAISTIPKHPVVLGDAQHIRFKQEVVFENAPQSLRDIEETLGFET